MDQSNIYFETERLYLTYPSENDFEYLCLLQSNPLVMKFFGGIRARETVRQKMIFFSRTL